MLLSRDRDAEGRVVVKFAEDDGPGVGSLRENVKRFCKRVGIERPSDIERVYAKWDAKQRGGQSGQAAAQQGGERG